MRVTKITCKENTAGAGSLISNLDAVRAKTNVIVTDKGNKDNSGAMSLALAGGTWLSYSCYGHTIMPRINTKYRYNSKLNQNLLSKQARAYASLKLKTQRNINGAGGWLQIHLICDDIEKA